MKKAFYLLLFLPVFSCTREHAKVDFRGEMRKFVKEISAYARSYDHDFIVIPQNGQQLVSSTGDAGGDPVMDYIHAIDGIGREDLNYGYENDDVATPEGEKAQMLETCFMARNNGLKVLVTDYCSSPSYMSDSYLTNYSNGFISFAADHRDLDNIPSTAVYQENNDTIRHLSEAHNFLYLINPDKFLTKEALITAVTATNYDLIIMDLFFNDGSSFTLEEVNRLKRKANGGKRLVISYMSIGECEDYRYYWQFSWTQNPPVWFFTRNPDWAGNYDVLYWHPAWKKIVYGNNDSYCKKIIDAGFDGAYLDIVDAFELFETQE